MKHIKKTLTSLTVAEKSEGWLVADITEAIISSTAD